MNCKLYLLPLLLCLVACAGNRRADPRDVAYYDLGPAPAAIAASRLAATLEVRLPLWLDSPQMQYRLLYAEPNRVQDFVLARWVASPSALIGERLRQRLGLVAGSCKLTLQIEEFGQQFDHAQQSRALLSGEAHLSDKGRDVLAIKPFRIESPAAANARSGAAALAATTDVLAVDLALWMSQTANSCLPTAVR